MKGKLIVAIKLLTILLIINCPIDSFSQKSKKSKKEEKIEIPVTIMGNGTIEENGNIRGYFVYKAVDKAYGKEQNYHIELFDENFTELSTLKFKDRPNLKMLSTAYSSEELCFMFLNTDEKSFDYKVFSVEGKVISDFSSKLSNKEYKRYMKFVTKERLISLENGGFLSTSAITEKSKITFKVNKFAKGESKPIEYKFPADKKFNLPTILGVSNNVIVVSVMSSKKQLGPASYHIVGLDQENMKAKFTTSSDVDGEYLFVPYSMGENPDYNTIRVSGVYFNVNGNTNRHSKGLAMWELDSSGTLLREKYNAWSSDFKGLAFKSNGKVKKTGFLKVHETFSTKDGKTFAVAEGYRKRFNGGGLFTLLFNWPCYLTKYQTTDMVLFEMDKDFKVKSSKVFPKKVESIVGYGFSTMSVHAIAHKIPGMFGYSYAQLNEERDGFMFTFTEDNFRLFRNKKSQFSFNTVKFENGKFTSDKLVPSSTKGWSSTAYMASQFGKVAYFNYNYSSGKSEFRIIKVK
jgi:hypothetical protein